MNNLIIILHSTYITEIEYFTKFSVLSCFYYSTIII